VPLSLHSIPGHGSCFSLQLPLVAAIDNNQPEPDANELPVEKTGVNNQGKILLIDNDPLVLKAMQSLLESWQYQVMVVASACDVQLTSDNESDRPMLVIADYHLDHDANGVDLVKQILAQQDWQLPCIINSADPGEQVRQHTSDANFYFIRKPVKPLALKRLIRQLV
jgi:DNA-binding NtrC family response regulator